MTDEKPDFGMQQFNAADLLKRNTVAQLFRTLDDACMKQEPIAEQSYDTSFTKRVDLVEGLLWKYTPKEIKTAIKELHDELDAQLKEIDGTAWNDQTKTLNKQRVAYTISVQIFKLLEVVLTHSPISVEYVEMEVMGDFKQLIEAIRKPEQVRLFGTEITG